MNSGLRHGAGFVVSGGLAFVTDASVLALLTHCAGLDPYTARLIAIPCAMVVGFFAHKTLTFAVKGPATLPQFFKFIGAATTASIVNYACYAGILLMLPGIKPLVALVMATAISMCVSYAGMRFGVFRMPPS